MLRSSRSAGLLGRVGLSALLLSGCGPDSSAGPSPLVGGIRATVPDLTLVADTGRVTAVALDSAGDTLRTASVALFNTTPDVALLLPDGRFIGRRPGVLVLQAVSGQVETQVRATVVDTSCGHVAAVQGWSGSMGFAYHLVHHHPASLGVDSFDVHVDEQGTITGAQLTGPFVFDSQTVYWVGPAAAIAATIHDADTVHGAGGDSVYTEDATAGAPPDYGTVDLVARLDACVYMVDGEPRGATAVTGPGVLTDSAFTGALISGYGTLPGGGPITTGVDSATLAIMTHDGPAGASTQGVLYLSGLPWTFTMPALGDGYPFPDALANSLIAIGAGLGTAHAVWDLTPAPVAAPHPSRAPRGPRVPWPPHG